MKSREVRLALAVLALVALMVAPLLIMGQQLKGDVHDPAYRALAAVGASLDGNRDADSAAAEALNTLERTKFDGREVLVRRAPGGICWVLDTTRSPQPVEGPSDLCS